MTKIECDKTYKFHFTRMSGYIFLNQKGIFINCRNFSGELQNLKFNETYNHWYSARKERQEGFLVAKVAEIHEDFGYIVVYTDYLKFSTCK